MDCYGYEARLGLSVHHSLKDANERMKHLKEKISMPFRVSFWTGWLWIQMR